MQESIYAFDGRQEYVKILGDLTKVFLASDYKNVIAWHESLADIVDFVCCRVDKDKESIYIERLEKIEILLHKRCGEAEHRLNKIQAYKDIRQLFRDCMRDIADSGLWGMVHKKVHPSRTVEDLF